MEISMQLPLIWMCLVALVIMTYVILDGFDLGVGILLPWVKDTHDRNRMISSVAPFWDGNETWLILAGLGLFAAFPKAYVMLLPALYVPILLMLFALILRGVSFEFRSKSAKRQRWWDFSFCTCSWIAALMQGMIVGTFVQGFPMEEGNYVGGPLYFLNGFSLACGISIVVGYGLLGATWLIMKTQGELQNQSYKIAKPLIVLLLLAVLMISFVTPWINPAIALRWFSLPNLIYLAPIPFYTFISTVVLWSSIRLRRQMLPFVCTIALFILCYLGLFISMWPYIVPYELTLWDAAAETRTQLFGLSGLMLLLPIVVTYTFYNYWSFRKKARTTHS